MSTSVLLSPGQTVGQQISPRSVFTNPKSRRISPSFYFFDGAAARDPDNAPTSLLRAGLIVGKESNGYANSIIGISTAPLGGAQTTLIVPPNAAVYVVRGNGVTGTFNLTGEPEAGAAARTLAVVYSAVNQTTGSITITPTATSGNAAVNAVQTATFTDSYGTGTFTVSVEGLTTSAITYSLTNATLVTNINAQLDAAFGTAAIVASDGGSDVAGTNQVEAVPYVDVGAGNGTYTFTIEGITTGNITFTHSDSAATTVGLINTALNAAFGTSQIVASGASLAAIIFTFSGTLYRKRPIAGHVVVTFGTLTTSIATINGGGSASASTTTTPGVKPVNNIALTFSGTGYAGRPVGAVTLGTGSLVNVVTSVANTTPGAYATAADEGEFVAGSLVQPTDGSGTPISIFDTEYGTDVLSVTGQGISQPLHEMVIGGDFASSQIINLTTGSAGAQVWLKAGLRATGGTFTFDDDR